MRLKFTLAIVCMLGAMVFSASASAITVPNIFVRYCSRWTGHCTGFTQTNGRYNPAYPIEKATIWTWSWIW